MSRLRWLVIAVCLVLGACDGVRGRPGAAACDYLDFIRLGGVTYEVADHGVGRAIDQRDLGPMFARITGNPPTSGDCRSYRPGDGDAAFLASGSSVYRVTGYRPSFRLAASHHGRLRLYEAQEAASARVGADLLDLAGKVRYLSVNSGRVELARIKERDRVAELVRLVLAAPVGSARARAENRFCAVVFNMVDRTAVRRMFFPETGELMPGVFAPQEFSDAVVSALDARQRTCGPQP
jgi:hypothetical protein